MINKAAGWTLYATLNRRGRFFENEVIEGEVFQRLCISERTLRRDYVFSPNIMEKQMTNIPKPKKTGTGEQETKWEGDEKFTGKPTFAFLVDWKKETRFEKKSALQWTRNKRSLMSYMKDDPNLKLTFVSTFLQAWISPKYNLTNVFLTVVTVTFLRSMVLCGCHSFWAGCLFPQRHI